MHGWALKLDKIGQREKELDKVKSASSAHHHIRIHFESLSHCHPYPTSNNNNNSSNITVGFLCAFHSNTHHFFFIDIQNTHTVKQNIGLYTTYSCKAVRILGIALRPTIATINWLEYCCETDPLEHTRSLN